MSESANSMFENARDVHWLSSMNMILTKMVERIATLSEKYTNHSGVVADIELILRDHWNGCVGMKIIPMNNEREEVFTVLEPPRQGVCRDQTGFNLNTSLKACDCGLWQEHGYPCIHAVAVFRKQEISFADLLATVGEEHTYEWNVQLFKDNFLTVCIEKLVPDKTVLAPLFVVRKLGRPKKKRYRKRSRVSTSPSPNPPAGGSKKTDGGSKKKCSRCGGEGHNARTCGNRRTDGIADVGLL